MISQRASFPLKMYLSIYNWDQGPMLTSNYNFYFSKLG